jgi:DNA-directed RNA polymerase subunit RPC12/RpoP
VNPWRKAFARHHCPACGTRVRRVSATLSERLGLELALLAGFALAAWALSRLLAWSGLGEGEAWALAIVALALVAYPLPHRLRRYRCLPCGREYRWGEVKSEGFTLRPW